MPSWLSTISMAPSSTGKDASHDVMLLGSHVMFYICRTGLTLLGGNGRIQARREVMSFLANQLYFNRIPVGTRATAQKAEVLTGDSSLVYQQSNGKRAHRFTRVFTPEMTISINYSIYKNQRQSVSHLFACLLRCVVPSTKRLEGASGQHTAAEERAGGHPR